MEGGMEVMGEPENIYERGRTAVFGVRKAFGTGKRRNV